MTNRPSAGIRYRLATAFWLALDSIRAHKLRSFLTLLGVIIGVSSVVLVGSAIEGLGTYAEQSTAKAFGTDSYLVAQIASAGRLSRKEISEKIRKNHRFQLEDVQYLRETTGDRVLYSPYRQRFGDVKAREETYELAALIGASASLPEIRDVSLVDGRFFTDEEERNRAAVAVIGQDIREKLFPQGSSLGSIIRINGIEFRIIGIQEKLGSAFGRSMDNSVYMPVTMFNRLFGVGQGFAVFGRARPDTGLQLDEALDVTRAAMRAKLHNQPGKPDTFDVLTPDSIRSFLGNILGLIAAVVVPVTCISLVVGGIVIMNIMLVSVTERTREIGVRKSLGARRSDILMQFLIEAAVMASVGGLIGIAVGAVLVAIIGSAFQLQLKITLTYVFLSVFVSATVGIVSGWYPANRASKLDPVEALRAE
ncbi:MAG TPA: ABC transporter permease [Bryobacteraceae bacterium]|nr:ABC transporter permease [Bryobacteraceae bacterium]